MNETTLKLNVAKMIKKEFPDIFFWKENNPFISGIPDLIMCVPVKIGDIEIGVFSASELKTPESREPDGSKIQQYRISQIIQAKGFAGVHKSVDEVRRFLMGVKHELR